MQYGHELLALLPKLIKRILLFKELSLGFATAFALLALEERRNVLRF
jgi:hypothetical protein